MEVLDTVARILAYPVGTIIALNGVDDIFIDLNYLLRGLFRKKNREISVADLKARPQQRIAVLLPAWHEAAVIEHMLENTLRTIDYDPRCLDIFVGTYPNDPETQERVEAVSRRVHNVHQVVVPHEGPTSKADCLNWIYQGIILHEERTGARFDVLVMQDAEDIVHPLAFRLYNYLIPDHDFVQTPVFPLEPRSYGNLVAGTYIDEFTESHIKDMLVRERIGGLVPSAGVGSAFAREAFEEIALAQGKEAFDTESFTEDYRIGLAFRLADKKVYFACNAVRRARADSPADEYIATREYFPDTFRAAVRQRSRWILGIVLQTWAQVGWRGSPAVLYCLWRDRKSLITHFANLGAYLIFAYCLTRQVLEWAFGIPWSFGNVFPAGSFIWWLLLFNTLILAWRATAKFLTVERVYGMRHAALSFPRLIVGNAINVCATAIAVKEWAGHKLLGHPLRWAKTVHSFPTTEALVNYHRRLGELLVDRDGLTRRDLDTALRLQQSTGDRLGGVLEATGLADEPAIARALGHQYELPTVAPRPAEIPLSLLRRLPEREAERYGVLPIEQKADDLAVVAVTRPLTSAEKAALEVTMGMRIRLAFAPDGALRVARERAYRRLALESAGAPTAPGRLGERLVELGVLTRDQLDRALEEQPRSGERLAELLMRKGWASAEAIETASTGALHEGFRAVLPEEADPIALRRLGYGVCAMYTLVPLHPKHPSGARIAAGFPLHREVRQHLEVLLGEEIGIVIAPVVDVRVALAVASRAAWPRGIAGGIGGLDGAELLEAANELGWDEATTTAFVQAARTAGRSPIDHLVALGSLDEERAAHLRSKATGLPMTAPRAAAARPRDASWLPPTFDQRDEVDVLEARQSRMLVATSRPEPPLARQVAGLYPDRPVTWRVVRNGKHVTAS